MKIYVPYSLNRDIFNGEELKFAIRSIEKYLSGWEDIILIGTAPDWFNGKVIEANDIDGRKEESIYRKMLLVKDEEFIMYHDDHFLLKSLDIKDFKQWHNGTITDELKTGDFGGRYRDALLNTVRVLSDVTFYDVHAPIIFNRDNLRNINLEWGGNDGQYCLKTVYCDSFPSDGEKISDIKFKKILPKEEIKKLIEGRLFFSTGTLFDPMRELLNELYPTKSKYEK